MKYYIDLHIHSALSPCADNDMTPNNIVNMAVLKGLDFIAVTDHNSAENVEAVVKCAEGTDLLVIPGMEVQTVEEVHVLTLFPTVDAVKAMEELVVKGLPTRENIPEIFGEQIVCNSLDEIIKYDKKMLLASTALTIDKVKKEVEKLNGVIIPAHIDKKSFSIVSNLGFISNDLNISTVEVSKNCKENSEFYNSYLHKYKIITNSDAHYLGDISERKQWVDLQTKSIDYLFKYIKLK